jgi:hypothetical protein
MVLGSGRPGCHAGAGRLERRVRPQCMRNTRPHAAGADSGARQLDIPLVTDSERLGGAEPAGARSCAGNWRSPLCVSYGVALDEVPHDRTGLDCLLSSRLLSRSAPLVRWSPQALPRGLPRATRQLAWQCMAVPELSLLSRRFIGRRASRTLRVRTTAHFTSRRLFST